jgi:hypothetical protein
VVQVFGAGHLPSEQKHHREVTVDGHDVVIVQTKDSRLGMYLLGQALFSREAIKVVASPRSIRTIALCTRDDLWSKRPGKKVSVPRFSLESWAQHMSDPKQYANMLREHARSIREQLKLLDKRKG